MGSHHGMSSPLRKMATGAALFLAVFVVAVIGYMASGWRLDDSIYMVIITIFGVGYGEVHPIESPALRALTIVVIISGYGAVIYTVGGFMQMVVDGELNKAFGARRMAREIERLRGHTILCGLGRMGTILAEELQAAQIAFVVIETDERRLQEAEQMGYLLVEGDATEEPVLHQAGIDKAATLATVLSEDATNVFVTITARELNPDVTIIARGENPRTKKKLLGCGADHVILPTAVGAQRLAQMIIRPSAESMLRKLTERTDLHTELNQIGLHFDELTVAPDSALVGRSLNELELRGNHGFLIVGIRTTSGETTMNPPTEAVLSAGDVVIVLGHANDIPQLAARISPRSNRITYRGVTMDVDAS